MSNLVRYNVAVCTNFDDKQILPCRPAAADLKVFQSCSESGCSELQNAVLKGSQSKVQSEKTGKALCNSSYKPTK